MNEYLDMACGLVIFVYCACRLGGRQWRWHDLEFWAHLVLVGSAVAIVVRRESIPTESVLFRLGVAGYFMAQIGRFGRCSER